MRDFAVIVLPVPFTPIIKMTVGLPFARRIGAAFAGKIRAISSRTAFITSPIPSRAHASRSCSVFMMRVVIDTPRSARMSPSSSSSQSMGLAVNCWASDWRNFISVLGVLNRRSFPERRALSCHVERSETSLITISRPEESNNQRFFATLRMTMLLCASMNHGSLFTASRAGRSKSLHAIENAVYETPRLRAAVCFCQLDRFINRNDWRNVIAIKHLIEIASRRHCDRPLRYGEIHNSRNNGKSVHRFREMRHHSFDERLRIRAPVS